MDKLPFSPWPAYSGEEIAAAAEVLRSGKVNYWTGEECRSFEREFATWAGTTYAVALANGTVALELALRGLGVGPGDEVIVTPRAFIASASCVMNVGALPIFADIDRDSGNLAASTIAERISPRTKAIIVVHLAGWPADMDPIIDLARRHGIRVIEDCAQAHGARYKGRSVGSIGDVGCWSFCQDKIVTTGGEGGMVTTNDEALFERMWSYKDHGKSWHALNRRDHAPGFRWVHESVGTNWRMTEMQAAIGRIQLRGLAKWSATRRRNAARLSARLEPWSGINGLLRIPRLGCGEAPACAGSEHCQHAFYRFQIYIRPERLRDGWSRDAIVESIARQGFSGSVGGCGEIYREVAFQGLPAGARQTLPVARDLAQTSIALPVHPTLEEADMDRAASIIESVLANASAD